jgi:alkylation response protein AidB-like acyl-CoA dehydrogenase
LSEPQSGSDAASLQTVAEKVPGGYKLTGNKQWITSGDRAGVIIVWARTDGGTKVDKRNQSAGLSAFIVEGGTPGLSAGRPEHKLGLKGSTTVPLILDGCFVPESALLARPGDGFKIAMVALDGGRIGIASQAVGIGRAALLAARDYSKERKQFGQPLCGFSGDWQHAGRRGHPAGGGATAGAAGGVFERRVGLGFSQKAAMAKLYASEAAGRICDMALQVHGGYGYTREYPVERYLRDARVQRIYEGTSEIQRLVIARSVLKEFSDHAS